MNLDEDELAFETMRADALLSRLYLRRKYEECDIVVDLHELVLSHTAPIVFDKTFCESTCNSLSDILLNYDEEFQLSGLTYAFVNVFRYCNLNDVSPKAAAETLVRDLSNKFACNFRLALSSSQILSKLLLDISPNSESILRSPSSFSDVIDFCASLPLDVLVIPKEQFRKLEKLGIKTCGDIIMNRGILSSEFPEPVLNYLFSVALGIDCQLKKSSYKIVCDFSTSHVSLEDIAEIVCGELCFELNCSLGVVKHFKMIVFDGKKQKSSVFSISCTTREVSDIQPVILRELRELTIDSCLEVKSVCLNASLCAFVQRTAQKTLKQWVVQGTVPITPKPVKRNFMDEYLGTSPAARPKSAKKGNKKGQTQSKGRQTTLI